MKTIKVNDKVITFDMWDELKARDLAKIQKVQSKAKEWEDTEMMYWFVEQFCSKEDLETVKDMNIKGKGLPLHVFHIQIDLYGYRQLIAAINLSPTCQAWY